MKLKMYYINLRLHAFIRIFLNSFSLTYYIYNRLDGNLSAFIPGAEDHASFIITQYSMSEEYTSWAISYLLQQDRLIVQRPQMVLWGI